MDMVSCKGVDWILEAWLWLNRAGYCRYLVSANIPYFVRRMVSSQHWQAIIIVVYGSSHFKITRLETWYFDVLQL